MGIIDLLPLARFKIYGESMAPYFPHGKRIFVNRLCYLLGRPKKGDVVIMRDPRDGSRELVKRITAVPGDEVGERILREDEYFVVGDNMDHSHDSRLFGPITRNLIVGKAIRNLT